MESKQITPQVTPPSEGRGSIEEVGQYPSAYRRVFQTVGNVALVLALSTPITAIFIISPYMIVYAGFWGLTWGWIIPWVLFFPVSLATAELCSAMPMNGAFYWWTGALAPRAWSQPLAYVSGWLNVMQLLTGLASVLFAGAQAWTICIGLFVPSWVPNRGQTVGIGVVMAVFWVAMCCLRMERVAILFMINCGAMLVLLVVFVVGLPASHKAQDRPFASGGDVFGTYNNFSDWNSAVAVPMSFFAFVWTVTGWFAPAYVAETTQNSRVVSAKSMPITFFATAGIGLLVTLVTAFCIEDLAAAAADPTGFPIYTMMIDHWGITKAGVYLIIIYGLSTWGTASFLYTSSCIVASFARDGGLPHGKVIGRINTSLNIPVYSILLLAFGGCLILLFGLSPEASSIIYSLAVIATMLNFLPPMILRVYQGQNFVPGPFNYGRWSMPIHCFAILFVVWIVIMESFPAEAGWTAATFNYDWVVAVGAILLSIVLWFLHGRKHFKGVDWEVVAAFNVLRNGPAVTH